MNRQKILQIVNAHKKFFCAITKIYNGISLHNKLHAKGCKVSTGVSVIKGLKIINYGQNNQVTIGDFVRIESSTIILHGDNNKIEIKDYAHLNQVELYTEDSGNEISIGERSTLYGKSHFAAIEGTKIIIGNDCLLSGDLHFRTGDSHSILDMQGERVNPSEDIIIEDHVWIGTKVTCLKGVRVSSDSVVAATTTLCKKYDTKNVVIGGVPGKIIKTDVNWTSERI